MPPTRPSSTVRAEPILTIANAWKSFGHVTALRDASLAARPGEVLALVGDNGAGKSTLVKVLAGVYGLDFGTYWLNGHSVDKANPMLMRKYGISAVYQDLGVVETLDVAANMFLGQQLTRFGFFANRRAMMAQASATLQQLKVRLPSVRTLMGELSGGQRQSVAVARAVLHDNPVVLMDEPTAALGVRETAQVAETIRLLRASGKAIILVSHDLELVFEISDCIQVLRLGQMQGARITAKTSRSEVIGLITGAYPPNTQYELEAAIFGDGARQ